MAWEELIRRELKIYAMAPIIRSIWYSQIEKGSPFYRKLLLYIKDNNGYYYENFDDHHTVGEWLIKRILEDEKFWEHHIETWNKMFNDFNAAAEKLKKTDIEKLGDKELVELHAKFLDSLMRWHGYAYAVDAIDAVLNEKIRHEIKAALTAKFGSEKVKDSVVNRYYSELTTAKELTYINREQILLLKAVSLILRDKELTRLFSKESVAAAKALEHAKSAADHKDQKQKIHEINKLFDEILEKYYWSGFTWDVSEMKTLLDLVKAVKDILKEKTNLNEIEALRKKIENHSKNVSDLKEKIISELKLDLRFRKYIEIFEAYAVFHDLRKEGQVKGTYYSYCILREYCHRLDLNFELARNALPEEIQECMLLSGVKRALKAKEYAEVMRRRKDEVLFVITHDDLQEVYGKDALSIRDKETRINVEKNLSEFQGLAANPGRVRGIARVCLGADEANRNIKEGDILVTGMTMPEYAPAMRKAAAIITDEGGLTCHAAIISRELGKPCIVGTKIGTRILKDGAAIEVNANHGIVKILEQTHNV